MVDITLGDVMAAVNTRATETKLTEVDTKIQTLLTNTDGLEGLLTDIRDSAGIKRIVDAIDIADRAGRVLGKVSADDGAIAALGALAAAAVTDPTAAASVIALLKGLLRQLQGAGTGSMPVTLNGRNVQPVISTWAPSLTGFDPGISRISPVIDLSAPPGVLGVGFAVDCDQPIQIEYWAAPSGGTAAIGQYAETVRMRLVLPATTVAGNGEFVPPFRALGGRYCINLVNRGTAAPTRCTVYTYVYRDLLSQAQNVRALLIRDLQIRDTVTHTSGTDPNNVYSLIRFVLGGGKVPIYVLNTLNQAVDLSIILRLGGVSYNFLLGTKTLAAGAATVITNYDFAGIDAPSEVIQVEAKCSVAPTSGALNVWIDSLIGGM